MGITRYAVINGKAQNRVDTRLPSNARPDMLYRITMNVHDDTFLLSLQGSMVDNWTELAAELGAASGSLLRSGEESRLRWVQITHQYDMLGRLCAYLAPYDIQQQRELATMSGKRKTEPESGGAAEPPTGAVSPALARAVSLHLEGKHKEALSELNTAIENGEAGRGDLRRQRAHPV